MNNTPKVPGALSIIAEQLPKWWNDPGSEGLKGTVETMIPQDAVDLGLMVAGGPGGKLARKAGVALMGAGASTDAEAGNIIPAVLTGMKKFLPELMVDLRKGASRSELMQKYGMFPLTHNAVDVVEHLPTPGSARVLDKTLLARMSDPAFSNPQARAISLGELLNHPELYAKVPDLKGLTVAQLRGLRTAAAGEYSLKSPGSLLPKSGRHEPGADTGLEMIVTGANPFERHPITPHFADVTPLSGLERGDYSLLDHEVNHALQARARGSVTDGPWETRLHEVNASLGAQDIPTDTLIQQLDEVFPLGDFQGFNAQKFEAPNIGNSSQQALALQNLRGLPNLRQRMRDFTGYAEGGRVGMGHARSSGQDASTQPPPSILQIKGPSNKKPNDEYLPFVQDFVRSGKWSDIDDLHHTGLRRATDAWNPNEEKMIRAAGIDFPTYATQQEIDAINQRVWPGLMGPAKPPGYAEGGSVTAPTWQDAFNEFDKAHRAEFGIGIDRPWAKDEDSVAAKQRIDQRYIDLLKAYDPTLTPDQSVLGANAQPNAYQPKPEGGGWLSQQLSNIGNIFRPITSSVDDFAKDVRAGAGGVVNEAAQLASEATGGIVSPDAAKVIAAIAYAVATGDPKTAVELGATEAEVAAAIESASTGASFGWTDAIASSLSPELLSTSPYISEFGSATLGDAALAGATGGGSQIGYNLANVGQTVDEINNASRISDFLGGQTQNLVGNTASSVAGPFGPVVNVGRNVLNGAPVGKAVTNAVGSAALAKAVQGVSKATGIPSVVVSSGANYGITGNAPQASDIAKAAILVYSADKARQQQRPPRPVRRA